MADLIRVTDQTPREELAAICEGRVRRLMAERCGLPRTWMARGRRGELLVSIDEALDEYNLTKLEQ